MFGGLLSTAARRAREAKLPAEPTWRQTAAVDWPERAPAADVSSGVVDLESEIRMVLTAAGRRAQRRSVALQMAVEPRLAVAADPGSFRACLRDLVAGAIERAAGGVLVTAMQCDDTVAVEVLDDGAALPEVSSALPLGWPLSATLTVDPLAGSGTKVRLSLRHRYRAALPDAEGPRAGADAVAHRQSG